MLELRCILGPKCRVPLGEHQLAQRLQAPELDLRVRRLHEALKAKAPAVGRGLELLERGERGAAVVGVRTLIEGEQHRLLELLPRRAVHCVPSSSVSGVWAPAS